MDVSDTEGPVVVVHFGSVRTPGAKMKKRVMGTSHDDADDDDQ